MIYQALSRGRMNLQLLMESQRQKDIHSLFKNIYAIIPSNINSSSLIIMTSNNQLRHQSPDILHHLNYLRELHLDAPKIGNSFLEDSALKEFTYPLIGHKTQFLSQLTRLGDRFSTVYLPSARNAQENPPRLEQADSFGFRINKLHLSEGWKQLAKYSAEDGIVALSYQKDKYGLGHLQRYGQLIALYMYEPSSGLYACPLAMTDGAAYVLKRILEKSTTKKEYLEKAFLRLTSRTDNWTSGQWMTEKKGGSDVSNTQTIAIKDQSQDFYRLYGYKWFTSATDSSMTLALAKVVPKGTKVTPENIAKLKVSLFYVEMRKEDGETLNEMEIIRLKDKLGTRQLPTAQILLKGSKALLISQEGQGVKEISNMLKITRIYNAASAVGVMRRGLALSRDYAQRRKIGKNKLSEMPLQLRVLGKLDAIHRGNLMFLLRMAELFSKEQAKIINAHQANILRVMTPLLKLFTGKQCVAFSSEILQSFGGMGYIEGTGIPNLLRSGQVLAIWQGTTNVLCYDFVRAIMKKENEYLPMESLTNHFMNSFQKIKEKGIESPELTSLMKPLILSYNELFGDLNNAIRNKFVGYFAELRTYCFALSKIFLTLSLLEHYLMTFSSKDLQVVRRWVNEGLYTKEQFNAKFDRELAMDVNEKGEPRGVGDFDVRQKPRSKL